MLNPDLRWFLWERFRYNPSLASENSDLELKRPREGPLRRRTPMIAKPNKDNRRGVTREGFTTSRPRTGPHGHPGRPHRGRAHRRSRPAPQAQRRCPVCGRACEFYDMANRGAPRLWRAMDLARSPCWLEYAPCRVRCPEHGVRTEAVPWARHNSRFTRDFEDWVACLAVRCTVSAVSELARVSAPSAARPFKLWAVSF